MAKKVYTEDDLIKIAVEIRNDLKKYGLTIRQLKSVLKHALAALEYITFGEAPEVPDGDPDQT